MKKDAKIYIAGHRGLVGSAILRCLQAEGYANLTTRTHQELDLTRQKQTDAFFESEKPDYVFLAAAKVGGIWANYRYPAEFIYSNLAIQTNVLHASWKEGVKRLIFLGSSCIYPGECPQPMKEEHLLTGPLEPTNRPYATAKIAGIIQCEAYNRQYGARFLPVMPTNLYGPNDNFDLENSHVLPALIRKFHLAKHAGLGDWEGITADQSRFGPIPEDIMAGLAGIARSNGHSIPASMERFARNAEPVPGITLWGTGSPRREFLFVDDLARAGLFLMDLEDALFDPLLTSRNLPLINIGCGQDQSVRELAALVSETVGYRGDVHWDRTKPDGVQRKLLDISRLRNLNWSPTMSLNNGIRQTYEWYLSQL
ncbi:MAG: GDP-L-fucose synthase [FCB group bacterium]|nr:GDP-L-fucose synthase [FCB group bacterium]